MRFTTEWVWRVHVDTFSLPTSFGLSGTSDSAFGDGPLLCPILPVWTKLGGDYSLSVAFVFGALFCRFGGRGAPVVGRSE